jgi:hypothetical protein
MAFSSISVPSGVHADRLGICDGCPILIRDGEKTIAKDGLAGMQYARCGDCGCYMYLKGQFKDYNCPQGKW